MEVKRGTKKLIKVGSADGLSEVRSVALSNCDLLVPAVHVEIIYAFRAPVPSSQVLEGGLLKALEEYQEFAGRLSKDVNGWPVIALNGQGAAWIDAEANVALEDLMPFPPGDELLKLLPPNRGAEELLLIQVTKFTCGSMTLGIARHHQVVDGSSGSAFMDAWAEAVKGLPFSSIPTHDRSALRARDPPQPTFEHIEYKKSPPKPVTEQSSHHPPLCLKKLHFSAELLQKIKDEAMKNIEGDGFYSTFESLAGHLWRCITKARGLAGEVETKAIVAVSGRRKVPLPENYFGNVIFHACSQCTVEDLIGNPLSHAVDIVQKAIKGVDKQYMLSALDFVELQRKNPVPVARQYRNILSPNLSITSWAKLPLYKLDFGWGTPLFAGPPTVPFEGLLILIPSYTKDGSIDVVLGLFSLDMERLEAMVYEI